MTGFAKVESTLSNNHYNHHHHNIWGKIGEFICFFPSYDPWPQMSFADSKKTTALLQYLWETSWNNISVNHPPLSNSPAIIWNSSFFFWNYFNFNLVRLEDIVRCNSAKRNSKCNLWTWRAGYIVETCAGDL